jgi:hypothetical protein
LEEIFKEEKLKRIWRSKPRAPNAGKKNKFMSIFGGG